MRKLTLLLLSLAFAFTTYAQKGEQISEKKFQKNANIINSDLVNTPKSVSSTKSTTTLSVLDEGFEGATFPPANWTKVTGTSNATYQWTVGTAAQSQTGSKCARVLWQSPPTAQNEWLISPSVNLTTITNPVLEFGWSMSYDYAVSPYDNYDFRVKVSTNGGTTWTTVFTEDSVAAFGEFVYKLASLKLTNYATATDFKVAFQYEGNDGYNLFVDNVFIGELAANRLEIQETWIGFVSFDAPFEWSGYTQIPFGQSFPASFAADINNAGSATQNNVNLTVKELVSATSLTSTNASPISIAFQQHDTVEVTNVVTIQNQGNYKFVMFASSDSVPSSYQKDTAKVTVNSDVNGLFSRDNNNYDGWRTWNGTTAGVVDAYQIANLYEITQNTKALSISFVVAGGTTIGANTRVMLYEGWGRNLIAESDYHSITASEINNSLSANPIELNLGFTVGYPVLHKDSVYFAAVQAMGGSDSLWIAIGTTNQQPNYTMYIYDTDNKWYYYPKGNEPCMIRLKTSIASGVDELDNSSFYLFQNTPNPASVSTKIAYKLNNRSDVTISIADITGRTIMTLNKGVQNQGNYNEEIDLSKFASGTYFYTLKVGENQKTKKLIVK
jgi:hypothetical protein